MNAILMICVAKILTLAVGEELLPQPERRTSTFDMLVSSFSNTNETSEASVNKFEKEFDEKWGETGIKIFDHIEENTTDVQNETTPTPRVPKDIEEGLNVGEIVGIVHPIDIYQLSDSADSVPGEIEFILTPVEAIFNHAYQTFGHLDDEHYSHETPNQQDSNAGYNTFYELSYKPVNPHTKHPTTEISPVHYIPKEPSQNEYNTYHEFPHVPVNSYSSYSSSSYIKPNQDNHVIKGSQQKPPQKLSPLQLLGKNLFGRPVHPRAFLRMNAERLMKAIYPYYHKPRLRYPYYDKDGNGKLLYGYGKNTLYKYQVFRPLQGYL